MATTLYSAIPVLFCLLPVAFSQNPIDSDRFQCPSYACQISNCKLPACLCASTNPPLGMSSEIVPQFVVFTFNDVIRKEFYSSIKEIFTKNRRNPTGRRISSTLFVSDDEGTGSKVTTDYCLARKLYEEGHELASHTISHRTPIDWWKNDASVTAWEKQLTGQRDNMTDESDLPDKHVKGVRAPFLQAGGEKQFLAIASNGNFTYDSSLLLQSPVENGGYWPFTLDYGTVDVRCEGGICPKNCYKRLWEVPLTVLQGPKGSQCSFIDHCLRDTDAEKTTAALQSMYEDRYKGNRSPLVLNINMAWFRNNEDAQEGLTKFIDNILKDDDTFLVSIEQLLEYMKNPVPATEIDKIKALQPVKKHDERDKKGCTTKRGTGVDATFFISGQTLIIIEAITLTLTALILIARDRE